VTELTNSIRQKGMALPITLAVMAILSALVFSIGHRGTLESKSLHHWVKRLEKEQRSLSCRALVQTYLSSKAGGEGHPEDLIFEVAGQRMEARFHRVEGAFDINTLRASKKPEKDSQFRELMTKHRLSLHRETLLSWILDHSGPHLDLESLSPSLRETLGEPTMGWPYHHPPFSTLPNGSIVVSIREVESSDGQTEILILEPRPKNLQVVASYNEY
jgi:hypothetical protein